MNSGWYSVIGLTLDIFGVLLLIREWWIAHDTSSSAASVDRSLKKLGNLSDDISASQFREAVHSIIQNSTEAAELTSVRPLLIKLGASLVVFGFVFQIIGSWPK